jgi:hypothetical protein
MFGDAIQAPTAMDVLEYNEKNMVKKWEVGTTTRELRNTLNKMSDKQKRDMFKS